MKITRLTSRRAIGQRLEKKKEEKKSSKIHRRVSVAGDNYP